MGDIEEGMDEKLFYGYWYENKVDGTMYIGKGSGPRIDKHLQDYTTPSRYNAAPHFYAALRKYGPENFDKDIFEYYADEDEAYLAEIEWIARLRKAGVRLYNKTDGGDGASSGEMHPNWGKASGMLGKTHTQEWKNHMSEIMTGRVFTEEHRLAISIGSMGKVGTNTGKTFDDEWRKNQAKALKGLDHSKQHRFQGEIAQEICDLYSIFMCSTHLLAEVYDCSKNVIKGVLVRNNIPIRPSIQAKHADKLKKFSTEIEMQICDKYNELENYQAVGKVFGCSAHSIRAILIRNNRLKA